MAEQSTDLIDVRTERTRNAVIVRIGGEIDLSTAPHLARPVDAALGSGAELLVLDFAGVTFFGSTGLQVIDSARVRASHRCCTLALTGCNTVVGRVLDLTGMRPVFAEYDTPEEAVSAIRAPSGTED